MRLQELYIKDYKVLQDFTLRFDEGSAVSVLIGENGSGKTTVVECLTLIFAELYRQHLVADLHSKATFPFSFVLRYRLFRPSDFSADFSRGDFGGGYFDVVLRYEEVLTLRIQADDGHIHETPEQISTFLQDEGQSIRPVRYLLPSNLVIYYSGISSILETIVDAYQQQTILSSLDGEAASTSELFYFKPENFPVLLISLLSFRYGNIPQKLATDFGIDEETAFESISIRVRRPRWAKPKSTSQQFWGAKGDLAAFLNVLRQYTVTEFSSDHITFGIFNQDQLTNIWSFYGREKSLFEYLATLQANGLIEQIDIDLRKHGQLIVPYQRLSEGEKQLLIIMALRELLAAGENTLFLLDEPDTYLHPEWKRNFIANFNTDEFLAYYLITTHSPGIVSGIRKNQLQILRKEEGRSVVKISAFDPYGKPENQILIDFFGLTGLRYKPVEDQLTKLVELVSENQYDSGEFVSLFQETENSLGKSDEGLIRLKLEIARRKRATQAE